MSDAFKCSVCGMYHDNVNLRYDVRIRPKDSTYTVRSDISKAQQLGYHGTESMAEMKQEPDIYDFHDVDVCHECVASIVAAIKRRVSWGKGY
jgi:hypothetical protein